MIKYRIFLILLIITYQSNLFSKGDTLFNIVGIWQLNDSLIASGLNETFFFFKNGKFIYNFSENNHTSETLGFEGEYKIINDTLYLYIKIEKKCIGEFVLGDNNCGEPFWVLECKKQIKIKVKNKQNHAIKIEFMNEKKKNNKIIVLNGNDFYKLRDNPYDKIE